MMSLCVTCLKRNTRHIACLFGY